MRRLVTSAVGALIVMASLSAQQNPPDLVLFNGKIITVDERFTIAQAVAVRGDQIVAVGTNQDIDRLAGPATRRIDLRGRSRHSRASSTTTCTCCGTAPPGKYEVRWDGVESRKEALELLRARDADREAGRVDLHPRRLGDGAVRRRSRSRSRARSWIGSRRTIRCSCRRRTTRPIVNSRALQLLGVDAPTGHLDEDGVPRARRQAADRAAMRRSKRARSG